MELKKKITLDNRGQKHHIPLLKKGESREIVCNLNWTEKRKNQGFLSKLFKSDGIDLDLGVYYELKNGQSSLIDGLQFSKGRGGGRSQVTRQGSYDFEPWIWHSGDDLTGSSSAGEFVYVNPKGISNLKRIQFYATIYESNISWADTDAEITINIPGHPVISINLGKEYKKDPFCLFCTIRFTEIGIEVSNETSFHSGRMDADKIYNWGFSYSAGSK